MAAPGRGWTANVAKWVTQRPNAPFTTQDLFDGIDGGSLMNAYGGPLTVSAVGSLLSEWAQNKLDPRLFPVGIRWVAARTYVYHPGQPNVPRITGRATRRERNREEAESTKPDNFVSNELLELVGTLPNGDVILRREDGSLRQYREVK